MLGWLQLAPAFGFPVTAPAGMLDRVFGATREAGSLGWALLLLGDLAFVAFYFAVIERRTTGPIAPISFAIAAWLVSGAVVMPLVGVLQGAPAPSATADDPMRANFFMLNLGPGAAAESFIGWLLFGATLAASRALQVSARAFAVTVGAAAVAAVIGLAAPGLGTHLGSDRVIEGPVAELPAAPVFISVLELPQPAGAVLGPHKHIAGFVMDTFGTATMLMETGNVVDVGPGDAVFTANVQIHDHENRAAIPIAIALAVVIVGLTTALVLLQGRRPSVALVAALLVAGAVATVNPLMNHWYFVGVRPETMRGAVMLVPAAHRTYESESLTGVGNGPYLERLTDRHLGSSESVRFAGPAAIVILDGEVSVARSGVTADLTAQAGTTIAGGTEATIQARSGSARVLVVQVLPTR